MNQKLYIIFGTGADSVGLVEKITTPISAVNGNIIDLRQDVLHGLFTVFMVVDLAAGKKPVEAVEALVASIAEETGLDLAMDKYTPVPRSAEKQNMLMILLGRDKPGIIASVTEALKTYNINIEFSDMIARENVFLMELMVDIRHCAIPLKNLLGVLQERMGAQGISTMFQSEDVFNKKKRILLFDLHRSFIDSGTLTQLLRLAGISAEQFNAAYRNCDAATALNQAANCLEGLPVEVAAKVAESVEVTAGTLELIQTLKIMGYKIALLSRGFSCVSDIVKDKLGVDICIGVPLLENDDTLTMTGELDEGALDRLDREAVINQLMVQEWVAREDITVISDEDAAGEPPPGLRLRFDMKVLLEYYNQHILSPEALIGILGSFGLPSIGETPQ